MDGNFPIYFPVSLGPLVAPPWQFPLLHGLLFHPDFVDYSSDDSEPPALVEDVPDGADPIGWYPPSFGPRPRGGPTELVGP